MTAATVQITDPGIYSGMPDDVYHADPVPGGSLSSTGARLLLPPGCPARFRYEQDHGREPKREFDFGHAAHKAVLGVGAPVVTVGADNWRTKAAQQTRDAAYAAGHVPLLAAEVDVVHEMADAIRRHHLAGALFDTGRGGKPEQSLFWRDDRFDVWRRARLDWLPDLTASGRLVIGDYKTCTSAHPDDVAKTIYRWGYHQQAAWYIDALAAQDVAADIAFLLVFQEKTAPYLVTVVQLTEADLALGRARNDKALAIYRECRARGQWPGYTPDDQVTVVSMPPWAQITDQELTA